ncbi:MAG: hypothetical protein KDK45_03890, partial [Leptospiraceae bacterium]|nr:hypothetical protein [Leptospiraceae bacterium]
MSKMEDIQNFWKIIQENIKELTDEESEELEIYEKILEALDKIHPEIFYEFMLSDDDILTLVLSAGGNKELFPLIEEMVSKAPKL